MIKLELTESEYREIKSSIATALQFYEQEIKGCEKYIEKYGSKPDVEGTLQFWKQRKINAEKINDTLSDQRIKGGKENVR